MKIKITILLIALFVLAFSAQALADEKAVAYIIGSETQGYDSVDSILVQLNSDLDLPLGWDWNNVIGDFKILDGITNIPVTSINTIGVPAANYFNLFFNTAAYPFGPSKNDLKLHYVRLSAFPIVTENGNLQNTSTAINIDDGVDPILDTYTITSNNANPFLGEAGDVITFAFVADEALAAIPVEPQVTFTIPEMKVTETVTAVQGIDNLHWSAQYTIPAPGSNLNGKVTVSATFWDVHANSGSLAATDTGTDGSFVTVKNYDPTYTYVGASFDETTLPTPYPGDTDDQIYLWNVFNTINECVDAVVVDGYVIVCSDITEDPTIDKGLVIISKDQPAKDGYTVYGDFDVTADNVWFENLTLDPDAIAITINSSAGVIDNIDVFECYFDLADGGAIGILVGGYTTPNAVSDIDIIDNTFQGPAGKAANPWKIGGYFGTPVGCAVDDLLFEGNVVDKASIPINLHDENITNIEVTYNNFTDTDGVLYVWDDAGETPTGVLSNFEFTHNQVDGNNSYGIGIDTATPPVYGDVNFGSGIAINYNFFDDSIAGAYDFGVVSIRSQLAGFVLDASMNYWGASGNGPDHVDNTYLETPASHHGGSVSDHVDYVSWYDSGTWNAGGVGWDPTGALFAPIEKDDAVKATTYFSSFQTAIDAAAAGDMIYAHVGYFDEQFTVDVENLTFQSYIGETATIQPTAAPAAGIYDVQIYASNTTFTDLVFDFGDRESVFTGIAVGEYDEVLCPAEVSGVEISLNEFYGDGTMIQTGYTIDITGLNIEDNYFYLDMDEGSTDGAEGIYVSPFSVPGKFISGVTIDGNIFEGYIDYGIAIDASNVTVQYNEIDGDDATVERAFIRYIDWYGNDNVNVVIEYNEMYAISRGIWVESHETTGTLAGTIQYNLFENCDEGILLATGLTTDLEITQNDFVISLIKGINSAVTNTTTVLADCESNWWNSVNGPDHDGNTFNVDAQGMPVTDYVDYVPWLNAGYATGVDFAPVKLHQMFKDDPYLYFSSIQAAIDAAVLYDEIFCYAGTFTEDFVVDVGVSLEGENVKQAVTLLGEQEVTASDVSFHLFEFDPDGAGTALLVNSSGGPIDNLDITYCEFTLTTSPSVGVYIGGGSSPQAISDVYMFANKFFGPDDKICNPWKIGGSFGNNVGCEVTDLEFSNNEVNKGSIPVNLVDEDIDDLYITYNDFFDTDGVIYFWNSPASSPTGVLSNFQFLNNYVPSSNSYGVAIGGASLGGPTFTDANFGTGNRIYQNAFEMAGTTYGYGAVYMADNYTGLLDASDNWWGDAYGPENDNSTYTPPAPLKGRATVSDRVEFAPWYDLGTDGWAGRGWEPDASAVLFAPVTNVTQSTLHSSIQRAVDGATAGDSISCLAGTFAECVTIDKNVRLAGASAAKGTTYLAPTFAQMDAATLKNVNDAPVLNANFQSVLLVDYAGTNLTTINDFFIDGSSFNTGTPASDGYFAGIFFDDCAGTVSNITFDDIYTAANKGVGVVYEDDSGTDKTVEVGDCAFNSCPTGALWIVFANAMGNIHDNTINGSRNTIMFLSSSSTTASEVDNNTFTNCQRGVLGYNFNANVKVDITDNTFDFSGINPSTTNVDIIIQNSIDNTYSSELTIDNNQFTGNWPSGTTYVGFASKALNFTRNMTGTTITNNTFNNFRTTINFAGFGGEAAGTNVEIKNNTFTNADVAHIQLGPEIDDMGTMAINYNSFDNTADWALDNNKVGSDVDAEKNWWGDATGPVNANNPHSPKGYGDGGQVSDDVDFIPWYATSTVTPTTEYVMTHSEITKGIDEALAYADAIQPAIAAAIAPLFPYVQISYKGSAYDEDLVVDNYGIYIYGEDLFKGADVQITGTHEVTASGVTFDNLTLTPGSWISGTVITLNSTSHLIENTTILNTVFNMQASPSIGVYVGGGTPTNAVNNTLFLGNTFNGPADMISNPFKVGGSFGSPVGCEIGGLDFEYNYVNYGSIPINIADKNVDLTVQYNTFANTDGVIYFWAEDVVKSPTGEITEFDFHNNYIGATNTYGVGFDVFGNFTGANYGGDIHIYENYFDAAIPGDYGFGAVSTLTPTVDLAGYVIDAASNWWGSEDGPTNDGNTFNVGSQGVAVSDNVDFVQWYDSGDNGVISGPGWEHDIGAHLFAPVEVIAAKTKAHPYYASIQSAVDGASNDDEIVCYEAPTSGSGTFYEDFSVPASITGLYIHPYAPDKAGDDVTIKGQATVEAALFPLADPNIEILGNGTKLEGFTIEAPNYVEGYYSSGIVVGALGVFIYSNDFVMNTVSTTGDISQAIQTYKDIDCSTLNIRYNTFNDNLAKGSWGYEAIYINPNTGVTWIEENTFTGMCLRAITIDDNPAMQVIYNNTIETTMIPWVDWSTSGAYQGINLVGDLGTVFVQDNYIGGTSSSYGFAQGIRVGSDSDDTFTNVAIGFTDNTRPNEISYNTYGILVKSATNVTINYNIIDGNDVGVQNDDTGAKAVLDATYNYWGATDGPSWTFDYGLGSGSGDEVSEYVDFNPWYQDVGLTTLYTVTMDQFLLQIDPASPYVDNYFDLRVCAADANGIRDFSYGNLADFSSSHVALSVPEEQLLVSGFKEITGACISALPFDAADHLTIYAWEYDTNPPDYMSELTDIVIQELNDPAPPTGVVFTDNPGDNGGWILVDYTLSIDDPFYTAVKDTAYGVSYYVVEIFMPSVSGGQWDFLADIACYDNGTGTNDYTALLPAPASDTPYDFRMASVYNPTKLGGFDENHISYTEPILKDAGAQSAWQTGSAAPKDNLPAYANMKVFLQGPYSNGTMTDGAVKPLVSPYDGETITALPLPNNQIIDWIYVELRLAATGETVKQANAFLLKNGTIVDVNGNSSLPFYYTTDVEYYLVIHHTNHIDIMSALTHTFGDFASQATSIDLTGATAAYGGGFASLGSGNYGLYGGDVNDNNSVTIGDAIEIYSHRGQTGYLIWDFNMNGSVTIGDAISCYNNRGKATTVPNQTAKDGGHPLDVQITAPGSKANTVDLQISNPRVEGGMFKMEVQLKRTSDWPFIVPGIGYDNLLQDADFQFDYNPAGFTGAPAYSNLNAGLDTAEYSTDISVAANALTLSITGPNPVTPTMYSPAFNVWETICTIELTIADIHENSGVVWNESGTGLISAASFPSGLLTNTYYGSGDITLPVELSAFNAMFSSANENIELRWDTATETDVNGFNIYRSEFKDLTRAGRHINYSLIPAAGTTTEPQSYNYDDVVADVYVTHYYWLEVVDFGGTSSFHGPIAYTPGDIDGDSTPDLIASTQLIGNFPNPAINSTKIKYQIKGTVIDQNATISVYNIRGELVKTLQGRNGVATLDTSDMGHGIYFYRLQTDDYSDIKKLIVVK